MQGTPVTVQRMAILNIITVTLVVLSCVSTTHGAPATDAKFSQHRDNFFSNRPQKFHASTCGYDSCNLGKPGMINVHLVPHTHDDVGWLKTVDQYYYGSRTKYQHAGVQYILDSVVEQLLKDPNKRFIYVEIAFFYRWWNQQHDILRHQVKRLINEGRLEFILGGWCMNDEATTHYTAIIDQHTLGFKFLKTNFGDCARPRAAWQIDPFGHSKEQASLFAQMGFDSLYFARLDYQDKEFRVKEKSMEMMWQGSEDLGSAGDLYTGVLFDHYGPPPGFCFDSFCDDDPIMDDDRLNDYNVDKKVALFINHTLYQASHYSAEHIMMTMGVDFGYQNANSWYKNLDKLIYHVNAQQANGSKVNAFYSTPSCYTYAKNRANMTWVSKNDDFFPYADSAHSFWTGYFTSRPALKYYARMTNGILQAVKQLDVLAELGPLHDSDKKLDALKRAMGVLQHHDAVTGTEKQHVAYDYAQRLARGLHEAEEVWNDAYGKLMPLKNTSKVPPVQFCTLLNISKCDVTEKNSQFTITLYNSVGRPVTHWIRLPVKGQAYTVQGPDGAKLDTQILPLSDATLKIPERSGSTAKYELVFQAQLPAVGFSTFFIKATSGKEHKTTPRFSQAAVQIKNEHLVLNFGKDGYLSEIRSYDMKLLLNVSQKLQFYKSFVGNNSKPEFRSSGAYIFRPNGSDTEDIGSKVQLSVIQGPLVQEVRQVYSDWASQVFRLYKGENYAEVEWTVGPIPIPDNISGKEVISLYNTNIGNKDGIFYTDSNGRQTLKRKIDYRPTWQLNQTEAVSGNYYPINSHVYLQDQVTGHQFTILTDRAQGAGCPNRGKDHTGELEIMIHRRTLHDDALGVGEALNETGVDGKGLVVRGRHFILLDTNTTAAGHHRELALRLFKTPIITFTDSPLSQAEWAKQFVTTWSGVKRSLPANVNLLTLEHLHGQTILLRLEHMYQKNEDNKLSQPVTVSLKGLFAPIEVDSVQELTLGATQYLKDAKRLLWNYQGAQQGKLPVDKLKDSLDVSLNPMQIRSFEVTLVK